MPGLLRSTLGDPDLRSPSGFDSGLRPPLRMTREAGTGAQSLDLRRIYWIFGIVFKIRFYAGLPALFFSCKLIKKPSPVGEGGPRQWWMRSPREKLTFIPTPHPSAFGCHLLPLEKAFVCLCATTSINNAGQPLHNGCPALK